MKHLRVAYRAVLALISFPLIVTLIAAQTFFMGPVLGNNTAIPNLFYKSLRKVFGIKVEFNKASAPLVKDKPVWFVANHMSIADFMVLGSSLNGSFIGKGNFLKVPFMAQVMRSAKYIGLRRKPQYNEQSRAKIAKNFNQGYNAIMFPEGTTSDGKEVSLFRAGLITLLFGEKAVDNKNREVKLAKDVVVQPVAMRVKEVNGENAIGRDDLRNMYSLYDEKSFFKRIYKRMGIKNMTLELTAMPELDPKNFSDAKELINKAAFDVAAVVNPGQTTFKKAVIPA